MIKYLLILLLPVSLSAQKIDLDTLNQSESGEVAAALGIDYQKMIKGCLTPSKDPRASQSNFWSMLIWFRQNANQDGAAGEFDFICMQRIEDSLVVEDDRRLLNFAQNLSEKDLNYFPFRISKFIDLEKMPRDERAILERKSPHLIKRLKDEADRK